MGFRFNISEGCPAAKKPYSFYYVQTIFYSTMLYCKFYFFSVIDFLLSCNCPGGSFSLLNSSRQLIFSVSGFFVNVITITLLLCLPL